MASTFSQAKSGLDAIANAIQSNRARFANIQSLAANASADLDSLATQYAQLIADIDAALVAAPTNEALKVLKAEKDLLVAEFSALLTKANQFQTAVEGITF